MKQLLVIRRRYYDSLEANMDILREYGYNTADSFLRGIVDKLNNAFSYMKIEGYRFADTYEAKYFLQYGAFIEGDNLPYDKVIVFFTPISSKLGNVIIEQSLMPTIQRHMNEDITFILNDKYKKIVLLTSKINNRNEIKPSYNKLQMDINSLNTMRFQVIPFLEIKNLYHDTCFNSLSEYLQMSYFLQKKAASND